MRMVNFLERQLMQWPAAMCSYEALKSVKCKDIDMGGGKKCRAQFNPARMRSTAAKVDAAAVSSRPCFLCPENRASEQLARPWGDYAFLVNPFPIFPLHFTIALQSHLPQRIRSRVCDMAELAQMLPAYTIFYNGPKCGASAPDHMHFQAGNSDFLPIWENLGELEMVTEHVGYPKDSAGLPGIIAIVGHATQEISSAFDSLCSLFPPGEDEPMMNLLCASIGGKLMLLIIPRIQHRPSFYGDGEGQMMISPASVDLAGVFITPRLQDYEAIDAAAVRELYGQLCMNPIEIKELLNEYAESEGRNTLEQEYRAMSQWRL